LAADYIQQLQVDNQGNLWVGGRHGYFTVSVDQFDALLAGKIKRLACQRVEEDYGTSNLFGFEGSPTACRALDGTTWIAAGMGVLKIPPQPIRKPAAVDVYVDHVRLDGQTMDTNQLTFLSGEKRIEFDFAAPTFTGLAHVQYRLDGHDAMWLDAEDSRSVSYTDLRPGSYAFLVRSAGHKDSVRFTVDPRWWEIVWLRVTAILAAFAGGIGYFQYRMRRAHQANAALQREISERKRAEQSLRSSQSKLQKLTGRLLTIQEEEDRRIARQLHDDISQRLSALTLDAAAIDRELQVTGELPTSSLENLQQKIVNIAADVHNISRRLHPQILEDLGLVKAVRTECKSISQLEEMEIELIADDPVAGLTDEKALCCYRVVQEALRNVAKHSQSNKATVHIWQTNGEAFVSVQDQGRGFDSKAAGKSGGIGLTSMRERVNLCSGQLSINSAIGQGTKVEVRMRLKNGSRTNSSADARDNME
jgi:signal transduction histidine kinase